MSYDIEKDPYVTSDGGDYTIECRLTAWQARAVVACIESAMRSDLPMTTTEAESMEILSSRILNRLDAIEDS